MEAPSFTMSTNFAGRHEEGQSVSRASAPTHQPSAEVERLARYIELANADYLNDDLAKTILATLNGSEIERLDADDLIVLQEPALKAAIAVSRWLMERPGLPLADIIKAVPRLRRIVPAEGWTQGEQVFARVIERYHAAKSRFRQASDADRTNDAWSSEAKRSVLDKLVVDGLREGVCAALDHLLRDIVVIGKFFPFTIDPSELASRMNEGGWYEQLSDSDLDRLAQSLVRLAPLMSVPAVQHILLFLNFRASSPFAHCARVNDTIIIPLAQRLFVLGMHEQAYTAVHWSLIFYAYRLSSEAEFGEWVNAFAPAAAAAGRRLALLDARSLRPLHEPIRLAFITRGGSVSTAAADHILGIMEYLRHDYANRFTARLYVFDSFDPDMEAHCAKRGVVVRFVVDDGIGADRVTDKLVWLQQILANDEVDVAIWTHAFDLAYFAFGMRLAPIQILFSQYLHPQPSEADVDGYITWGSPVLREQDFNGRPWRVVPSSLQFDLPDIDANEVRRLRSQYAVDEDTVVVGTLARAEKVGQPDYLAVISEILQRHPYVVFLWTGHTEHAEITFAFEKAGVLKQTRFVDWVDVHLYVRVLDILLDTFPLSNGITALIAMSSGTPILSLDTPLSFVGRDIVPAFRLNAPFGLRQAELASEIRKLFDDWDPNALPAASDAIDYIAKASRLIEDREFRARYGEAWQRTYRLIYANEKLMADTFVERLAEIIGERSSTAAPDLSTAAQACVRA